MFFVICGYHLSKLVRDQRMKVQDVEYVIMGVLLGFVYVLPVEARRDDELIILLSYIANGDVCSRDNFRNEEKYQVSPTLTLVPQSTPSVEFNSGR